MTYQIEYAYTCHTGNIRVNNEDNFWCCGNQMEAENQGTGGICTGKETSGKLPLLAVFDGMGGESSGEMAAWLAADQLGKDYIEKKRSLKKAPEEFLEQAAIDMNSAVCRYAAEHRIGSMGTTMAMSLFGTDGIYLCNLGDSRIYQSCDGQLRRVSTDHVLGGSLFGKAPLTQYLGIPEDSMGLEVIPVICEYQEGNRFLLCSDGVTDMLSEEEIGNILAGETSVEETVEVLLQQTLEKGGKDNVTIVLCEVREQEWKNPVKFWIERWKDKQEGD